MIEFNENAVGVWFVAFEGKDWMCGMTRHGAGFKFQYRFRYYDDPEDPWDGKDRKSWYEGTSNDTRDMVIAKLRSMAFMVMHVGRVGEFHECVREPDEPLAHYLERFTNMPFVHKRTMTDEEYRKEYGEDLPEPKP